MPKFQEYFTDQKPGQKFREYFEPEVEGTRSNPIQEMHPGLSAGSRALIMNLSSSPEVGRRYLERQGFEAHIYGPGYKYAIRKPGEKEFRTLDPAGFDIQDITDIGGDISSIGAVGLGAGLGAGGGPGGMAGGGALGGAGAASVKAGLGRAFGLDPTAGEVGRSVAFEGATGALAGAGGKVVSGLAGGLGKGLTYPMRAFKGRRAAQAAKVASTYTQGQPHGFWTPAASEAVEMASKGPVREAVSKYAPGFLGFAAGGAIAGPVGGLAGYMLRGGIRQGVTKLSRKFGHRLMGDTTGQVAQSAAQGAPSTVASKLSAAMQVLQERGPQAYMAAIWSALHNAEFSEWVKGQDGGDTTRTEDYRGRRPPQN